MNLLLAVHHFLPHYTGGAESQTYQMAVNLQQRGHRVRVVCIEKIDANIASGVIWQDDVYGGIQVRRLSFPQQASPDPFRWSYDNPWIGEHLRSWLSEDRPDLFHLISGYLITGQAVRIAQELGIPTVVSLMDFWFMCPRITMMRSNGTLCRPPVYATQCAQCLGEEQRRYRWPGKAAPGLMRAYWNSNKRAANRIEERIQFQQGTIKQTDRIISNSQFLRSVFIQMGVNPEQIIYLRQGRDIPKAAEWPNKETTHPHLRVGYIGQITETKGVHILFDAVQRIPDAQLSVRVFGDTQHFPVYSSRLRRMAAQDNRLEMAGIFRGVEEARQVMNSFDVVVVPSVWYENSPNAILEAFAYGLPVIASNLGGMAELIQDGINGLLFEPGNAQDLSRKLRRLVEEPDLLPKLRAGISPVKTVAEEVDEIETIYRQLINDNAVPSPDLDSFLGP